MRRIQTSININGYDYTVRLVDKDLIKGCDGKCFINEFLILIRNDLNKEITACVLRHEIAHAILCVQGRWSHNKFTQEDLCEFVGFNANHIVDLTNKVLKRFELL